MVFGLNIFKSILKKEDVSTHDRLGAYPTNVHVPAQPERRYLKTSRLMAILSSVFLCSAIVLGIIFYMLTPEGHVIPENVTLDPMTGEFLPVERAVVARSAYDLISESYIDHYVKLRYTIIPDIDLMKSRWENNSVFFWYSSKDVYVAFTTEKEANLAKASSGFKREVEVIQVKNINGNLWSCIFETRESVIGEERLYSKRWRALMRIVFREAAPTADHAAQISNPLNFNVLNFYVSRVPETTYNLEDIF